MQTTTDISGKLDEGKEEDAIFFYFSKAFDKNDHMKPSHSLGPKSLVLTISSSGCG